MFSKDGPSLRELLAQALTSTERGYDLLAPKFDATPFRTPDPVLEQMAKVIGSARSGLDVCCGTGAAMRALRPVCRERLVGIDFSQGMLDEARRRVAEAPGAAAVDFVRGDVLAMTFEREFDVVTSVGAFGHVLREDEDRFVAGIARALEPGGRFVFATTPKPAPTSPWFWAAHAFNAVMHVRNAVIAPPFVMYYLTFTWPEVRPLLERHGFAPVAHQGVCPAPYERVVVVEATLVS